MTVGLSKLISWTAVVSLFHYIYCSMIQRTSAVNSNSLPLPGCLDVEPVLSVFRTVYMDA